MGFYPEWGIMLSLERKNMLVYNEAFTGRAKSIARCNFCLQDDHVSLREPNNPNDLHAIAFDCKLAEIDWICRTRSLRLCRIAAPSSLAIHQLINIAQLEPFKFSRK